MAAKMEVYAMTIKNRNKPSAAALEDGFVDKLLADLDQESTPQLPADFSVAVEHKLKTDFNRRAALLFLESKTFKEWTSVFQADRDAAVTFATLARLLPGTIQQYRDLAEILETAHLRIELALAARPDFERIRTEVNKA